MKMKILFWTIALLVLASMCYADQAVINSKDWKDAYSAMFYAEQEGMELFVLESADDASVIPQLLDKDEKVVLFESDTPVVENYDRMLYKFDVDIQKADNMNLAKKFTGRKFIIVDDAFGYNAVSVAPYALKDDYFVVFSNKQNNDEVIGLIESKGATKKLVYGYVNEELAKRLEYFAADFIDLGTKTANNLEVVERYNKCGGRLQQVIFTDGNSIESSLISEDYPVVLLDKNRVDDEVIDFLINKGTSYGVVVGTEILSTAKLVKSKAGLSGVIIKYGQGISNKQETFSQITPLKTIDIGKSYDTLVSISRVEYNTALKELEVYYSNTGKHVGFVRGTLTITSQGKHIATVSDNEANVVDSLELKGVAYPVDLTDLVAENKNIDVDVLFSYGPESRALDSSQSTKLSDVNKIHVEDDADVELVYLKYNKFSNDLVVKIKNNGPDAFVDVSIVTSVLSKYGDYMDVEYRTGEPVKLIKGHNERIKLKANLDPEEMRGADVKLRFGERQNLLVHSMYFENMQFNSHMIPGFMFFITSSAFQVLMAIIIIGIFMLMLLKGPLSKRARRLRKLAGFIQENMVKGFSEAKIKKHLLKHKYSQEFVDEAFAKLK